MIEYVTGDATDPIIRDKNSTNMIIHICNDIDAWGAGFVVALSEKWAKPEKTYHEMTDMSLGKTCGCKVEDNLYVVNMVAQSGVGSADGKPPIRYDALKKCLNIIVSDLILLRLENVVFHCPRIGCGLAGGTWDKVEPILQEVLKDYSVIVYDLENKG